MVRKDNEHLLPSDADMGDIFLQFTSSQQVDSCILSKSKNPARGCTCSRSKHSDRCFIWGLFKKTRVLLLLLLADLTGRIFDGRPIRMERFDESIWKEEFMPFSENILMKRFAKGLAEATA